MYQVSPKSIITFPEHRNAYSCQVKSFQLLCRDRQTDAAENMILLRYFAGEQDNESVIYRLKE